MKFKYNPIDDPAVATAIECLNSLKNPEKFLKEATILLANVLNKA